MKLFGKYDINIFQIVLCKMGNCLVYKSYDDQFNVILNNKLCTINENENEIKLNDKSKKLHPSDTYNEYIYNKQSQR